MHTLTLRPATTIARKPTLLLLILSALVLLAACDDGTNDEPGNVESSPVAATQQTVAPAPAITPTVTLEPTPVPTETETVVPTSEPEPTSNAEQIPEPEPGEVPATPVPEPEPEPLHIPDSAFLGSMNHMYQTFNNCSAASVCMLLSHFDIALDQEALRPVMRPNDGTRHGKNEYMIGYLREQGFRAELMHGGDIQTLQAFLANDIPVIVQQWLDIDPDPIGHYSVLRGYDNSAGVFRLNDSMHGADFHIGYDEFVAKWRAFSYRYIPVYPEDKQEIVDQILGEETDLTVNRERTIEKIQIELESRPDDAELIYSLGTNLHDLGRYEEAVAAYERAESIGLPPKMLWYVYWPAAAYNEIGQHQRAIEIAEQAIFSAQTFGDMRYERARALEALGHIDQAIAEYRQAVIDDPKLERAIDALVRLEAE